MKYRITTPEQVHFHYEVGGLASRATAWIADQVILMAARIGIAIAFSSVQGALGAVIIVLSFFLLDFGYFLVFETYWAGQSPGKRLFKLRVVSSRGGRLRFPELLMRNLIRMIDTLPIGMLVGGTTALIDKYHRRIGDFAGETMVVKDAENTLPANLAAKQNRVNSFAEPAIRGRILSRVTREERDVALDLMLRRDEIEPAAREELFKMAASHLRKRYSLPEDMDFLSDEQTVLNVAMVILSATFAG